MPGKPTRRAALRAGAGAAHRNEWLSRRTDTAWVYGYDAWTAPLAPREAVVVA